MTATFTIVLRGYDRVQVGEALARADEALASESETARASARDLLAGARFDLRLRGYDRREVDLAVQQRLALLGGGTGGPASPPATPEFTIALRGYDRAQVEEAVARADEALASGSETARASARDLLRNADFGQALRGYDIAEVDQAIKLRLSLLG
jgi:DivIVA domain-containing protein